MLEVGLLKDGIGNRRYMGIVLLHRISKSLMTRKNTTHRELTDNNVLILRWISLCD